MVMRLQPSEPIIVEQVEELKDWVCGKIEQDAALVIQSIWRAEKSRRVSRKVKRAKIEAIVIIQRQFRILTARKVHIKAQFLQED